MPINNVINRRFISCSGALLFSIACFTGRAYAIRADHPGLVLQAAQTAGDQKNDADDLKLAAKIRKAIVNDKNLSIRAHNVAVIVKDGAVTLRGQVHSEQEREAIRSKAQSVAGSAHVEDAMTIKP